MGLFKKAAIFAAVAVVAGFVLNMAMDGRSRLYVPKPGFSLDQMPNLSGKVALVTGSNTGLGYATAIELARKGCTVYVACRSVEKQEETKENMTKELGAKSSSLIKTLSVGLDLGSFDSIKEYATHFKAANTPLNILVLNAGIMMTPFRKIHGSKVEQQFGVNHLGHFYLTMSLMEEIEKGQPSRVVSVSSAGHSFAPAEGIPFERLGDEQTYNPVTAYGISKLSNILFARELSRRVEGKQIFVNSCHPGYVSTELARHVEDYLGNFIGPKWVEKIQDLMTSFTLTPTDGALTQLYLAASPQVESDNIRGSYYVPTARNATDHFRVGISISNLAQDGELAKKLWKYSVDFTGLDYGN